MDTILQFFSFQDINIRYVVLGTMLLSASAAMVGTFILLKKKALVGDAVAHSVLPGICAAFLFAGTKNTYALIIGAFITGWLALVSIDYITAKSKIKKDAAIGLVLSVFFGIGIVLLTYIQQSGNAAQSGLDNFIFGKAAALVGEDVYIFGGIALLLALLIYLFFNSFTLIAFDENYAKALGIPVRTFDLLLTTLTILAVVTGITAVGVVLMAAMLITPPAAARYWTDNIRKMIIIAASIGAFSGLSGAYISYIAPAMPTGPWMVIVSSLIAFISFFFAPTKGIIPKMYKQYKHQRLMSLENTIKVFYHLGEERADFYNPRSLQDLTNAREWSSTDLIKYLHILSRQGFLMENNQAWTLTESGYKKSAGIVRVHRLWELYLNTYMNIASDHVHDDAETIEHLITPELEAELEKQLGFPEHDPHQVKIPKND